MRRGAALLLAALALGAAAPATPPARPVPSAEGFTQRMLERFRAALPDYEVTSAEPLALSIRRRGDREEPTRVYLGRLLNICTNDGVEVCEEESANFVRVFRNQVADNAAPVTRTQLRVAVRGRDYCIEVDRLSAQSRTGQRFLARPLPPDLCEVLMVDYPDRMVTLSATELPRLSLSADEAWALGTRQALANLPQLPALEGLASQGGLIEITDHEYIPTLLLARDGWRALAAAHGPLLVAVPGDEVMVVARTDRVDRARFRAMVADLYRTVHRQISASIYRWTEAGWVLVED